MSLPSLENLYCLNRVHLRSFIVTNILLACKVRLHWWEWENTEAPGRKKSPRGQQERHYSAHNQQLAGLEPRTTTIHPGGSHSPRTPLGEVQQGIMGARPSFRTHVPTVPAGLHVPRVARLRSGLRPFRAGAVARAASATQGGGAAVTRFCPRWSGRAAA